MWPPKNFCIWIRVWIKTQFTLASFQNTQETEFLPLYECIQRRLWNSFWHFFLHWLEKCFHKTMSTPHHDLIVGNWIFFDNDVLRISITLDYIWRIYRVARSLLDCRPEKMKECEICYSSVEKDGIWLLSLHGAALYYGENLIFFSQNNFLSWPCAWLLAYTRHKKCEFNDVWSSFAWKNAR